MTARIDAAATVTAPKASAVADPTHQAGLVFRVAHSATCVQATAVDIPAACRGRHWRMLSIGANVDWAWLVDSVGLGAKDTPPVLVYGQLSATGTGNATAAQTLLDSQPEHIYCPSNARGVLFISSSAAAAPAASFAASLSGDQTGLPK